MWDIIHIFKYRIIQYITISYYTISYHTTQYRFTWYNAFSHSTILYHMIQCNIMSYSKLSFHRIGTIGSVFVSKIVFKTTRSNSIKAEQDVAAIRIHKKFIFQIQRHYDVIHKIYQFHGHFCSLICYFKNPNIQTLKAYFTQYH